MTDPQVIVNLGTGGADLNGRSGSTTGADSNDPKFLPWEGENYVYLPGASGNYLSVPDEAALDITGDIDIRAKAALDTWTPTGNQYFVSKFDAVNDASFGFRAELTTGLLALIWYEDGTTQKRVASTVAPSVSDGAELWVRVTLDVDNGAGGYEVNFYTSEDGASWSQLGSTVTGGATTSIYASNSDVEIGSLSLASNLSAGTFHRAIIKDGIDGTTVLDVDTSLVASGSDTSFTARTGQTVTINRSTSGRKSVAVTSPVWLFGTDDYMEVADNALLDFGASDSFTVLAVTRQHNYLNAAAIVAKKVNASTTVGWLLRNGSTATIPALQINDGSNNTLAIAASRSNSVLGVLVAVRSVSADTLTLSSNGSAGSSVTDTTTGTLSNSNPMRIGRLSTSNTNYVDMEFIAAAVFRRALTASEIAALTTYYQNRVA